MNCLLCEECRIRVNNSVLFENKFYFADSYVVEICKRFKDWFQSWWRFILVIFTLLCSDLSNYVLVIVRMERQNSCIALINIAQMWTIRRFSIQDGNDTTERKNDLLNVWKICRYMLLSRSRICFLMWIHIHAWVASDWEIDFIFGHYMTASLRSLLRLMFFISFSIFVFIFFWYCSMC